MIDLEIPPFNFSSTLITCTLFRHQAYSYVAKHLLPTAFGIKTVNS